MPRVPLLPPRRYTKKRAQRRRTPTARRSVALEPEGGFSFRPALAVALAHLGREEEAKAVVDEVFRRSPEFNPGITRLAAPPRLIGRIEQAFARLGLEIG